MKRLKGAGVLAVWLVSSMVSPAFAQDRAHNFLKSVGKFDDAALARLDAGQVITRSIDTGDEDELALMGAAWMEGTVSAFLPLYEDIETFKAKLGPAKKFSSPPRLADVAGIELESGELKALEKCRVEDCSIHVSEEMRAELRARVDFSAPDADRQVLDVVRQRILAYIEAYQEGGNESLSVYRNKAQPLVVRAELEKLLDKSPYILDYEPELHRYLLDYPNAELPGASDFFYWSIIGFGPKPTLRLNHVTLYPVADGPNGMTIITSKQLYYSHYFDTGLELYALLPNESRPDSGFQLIALSRYRTDLGGGLSGKVMRLGASAGVEGAMKKTLENAQASMK